MYLPRLCYNFLGVCSICVLGPPHTYILTWFDHLGWTTPQHMKHAGGGYMLHLFGGVSCFYDSYIEGGSQKASLYVTFLGSPRIHTHRYMVPCLVLVWKVDPPPPPPPQWYIDTCIYTQIYILYTFAHTHTTYVNTRVRTMYIYIHTTYIYIYIYIYKYTRAYLNSLHIHTGTITISRGEQGTTRHWAIYK